MTHENDTLYDQKNAKIISEINWKFNVNNTVFDNHIVNINPEERRIRFNTKFGGTPISSSFIYVLPDHHNIYWIPYYFRIALRIGTCGNYILSERYQLYSIRAIKKLNLNVCTFYVGYLCYKNKINVLEYLKNNRLESINDCLQKDDNIMSIPSLGDANVGVLEWFKNSGLKLNYNRYTLDAASGEGYINVLEWWKNSGLQLYYSGLAMDMASRHGHINVLEWWKNSGLPLKYYRISVNPNTKSAYNFNVLEWWKNSGLLD